MEIDIKNGQKTGSFLDQQDNHNALKPYVLNKSVLDCFSHIGGFGLHAAYHKNVQHLSVAERSAPDPDTRPRL